MRKALFDKLPARTQHAYALGVASRMMGREQVVKVIRQVGPVLKDQVGHGDVDPAENFWGGVWQVYVAN